MSNLKHELLKQLDGIEKRQEQLKYLISDEQHNKLIVTSDKEFDDPSIDPRYEDHSYKSEANQRLSSPPPLTVPRNRSTVTGLYKGSNLQSISKPLSKNEELQKMKIEKQIKQEQERKKILRSSDDTKVSVSSLNGSLQKSKQQLELSRQRERERREQLSLEPYRSTFSPLEEFKTYNEVVDTNKSKSQDIDRYKPINDPAFDIHSRLYIAKRYLPLEKLKEEFGSTEILRLSHFFERTSSRVNELRENNFILVGLVSFKSDPQYVNDGRQKYCKLQITDFKFDIFLYLYEDAFSEYWKITPGTIIAVLNPEIIPLTYRPNSKQPGSNHYMLKLKNSLTILEYARFRDFGTCLGLNGRKCHEVVNTAKSRYCAYHQEKRADKAASNRNEMGSNYRMFAPTDEKGNVQVMVVTEKDIQHHDLVNSAKELNKQNSSGLAIEKAKRNVPSYKSTERYSNEMLLTDFSNPINREIMKTKDDKGMSNFSSRMAGNAFIHSNVVNKKALEIQEKNKELDRKLLRKKMMSDATLMRRHERHEEEMSYKKRKKLEGQDRIRQLLAASKNDKSLKKSKADVELIKREREEIQKSANLMKSKKLNNLGQHSLQTNSNDVQLSSDDDSGGDAGFESN